MMQRYGPLFDLAGGSGEKKLGGRRRRSVGIPCWSWRVMLCERWLCRGRIGMQHQTMLLLSWLT